MDKAQHSPKKPSAPIPEDFDIAKYGLVKDVSRWKDALARRVILQNNLHTLSDLLAECAQQGESSEFREGLCSGSRTNIQNKVLISLSEPIPLKKESFNPSNCEGIKSNVINGEKEKVEEKLEPFFFNGYNKLTDKKLYLELHKPISGTLYFDERWPPETRTPNSPAEVVIKVNLYHNDNVLIESFSEWLKEMRELYFPVAGKKTSIQKE